jgi:thioredoxin reductase
MALSKEEATGEEEFHGVLIVGGGICGLATALALHRYDIHPSFLFMRCV